MSFCYWPSEEGVAQEYGEVTVKKLSEDSHGDFVRRKFAVDEKKCDEALLEEKTSFTVTQFQFTMWPEHETPPTISSIIELVDDVNVVQMRSGNGPMTVMCK